MGRSGGEVMEIAQIVIHETTGSCILRKWIPAGLVGGTVSIVFASPVWQNLKKTVVFRGKDTRIAGSFDGKTAVIPWEVLAEPDVQVYFGLYGYDPERELQLPLIEVRLGQTVKATEPNADPGADPELPIWAELEERMISLEKNLDAQVESSVKKYLEKNPSSGGVKFETDETLTLKDGILSVNTIDQVIEDDLRPVTSGAVYQEFVKAVALLKTI